MIQHTSHLDGLAGRKAYHDANGGSGGILPSLTAHISWKTSVSRAVLRDRGLEGYDTFMAEHLSTPRLTTCRRVDVLPFTLTLQAYVLKVAKCSVLCMTPWETVPPARHHLKKRRR